MRKFFFKSLLLIIPVSFITFVLVFYFPPGKSIQKSLVYAHIDKNRLLQNTLAPRIIFIGGSNLSFGLNSQTIKDSLELNPINTAIHVSIGLKFMLSNAENYIQENDIVVVSPEYQQFYGELANGKIELLSIVSDVDRKAIHLLDFQQYISLVHYVPKYIQSKLSSHLNKEKNDTAINIYDRKAFNSFGDTYVHWNLPKQKVWPENKIDGSLNESAFMSLTKFRNNIQKKNARLFISFPCYQDLSYKNSTTEIKKIEQKLKEYKFELLSDPERYVFPDSMMFNSPYHLIKKGVDRRTALLIEDLKKVLR